MASAASDKILNQGFFSCLHNSKTPKGSFTLLNRGRIYNRLELKEISDALEIVYQCTEEDEMSISEFQNVYQHQRFPHLGPTN